MQTNSSRALVNQFIDRIQEKLNIDLKSKSQYYNFDFESGTPLMNADTTNVSNSR